MFAGLFSRVLAVPPTRPDRRLTGDETLDLPEIRLQTIHAPGHTLGSRAFLLPREGLLFAGDAVNGRGGTARPPWFVEDATAALASFRKLMDLRPRGLCPGHRDPLTGST